MNGFEKEKIMQNLVFGTMLHDQFQKLSVQKEIFSQRRHENIMKDKTPPLDYCIMLMRHGPNAFTQFIDILIETKQNDIVDLLLNNP